MTKDSYQQTKKFADFESEFRHFDSILNELQLSLYHHCHTNDYEFDVYTKAQTVRDTLFRLVRRMKGFPDETNTDDFDCGGGEVVKTE